MAVNDDNRLVAVREKWVELCELCVCSVKNDITQMDYTAGENTVQNMRSSTSDAEKFATRVLLLLKCEEVSIFQVKSRTEREVC
eukprot:scaffold3275_cov70-Cyclotella_meneghiniana.AAC.6